MTPCKAVYLFDESTKSYRCEAAIAMSSRNCDAIVGEVLALSASLAKSAVVVRCPDSAQLPDSVASFEEFAVVGTVEQTLMLRSPERIQADYERGLVRMKAQAMRLFRAEDPANVEPGDFIAWDKPVYLVVSDGDYGEQVVAVSRLKRDEDGDIWAAGVDQNGESIELLAAKLPASQVVGLAEALPQGRRLAVEAAVEAGDVEMSSDGVKQGGRGGRGV